MIIENVGNFSVTKTFDCGQCFRFDPVPGEEECFEGVAFGNYARFRRTDGGLEITDGTDRLFWTHFLSLDEDYGTIDERIRTSLGSERDRAFMNSAVDHGAGIRILRQDPWETLISFIISQNNNIPRIKGIIERLCLHFGEPFLYHNETRYAFPTPKKLASCTPEDLAPLRAGFRTKYLIDAAKRIASGEIDLEAVRKMPLPDAKAKLQTISGVGPKVADCALLYGLHRTECFPMDVWMKRAVSLLPRLSPADFGENAGIAQQYLFHYVRMHPELFK